MKPSGDLRDTFFQECEDLLEGMADGLRQLEADLLAGHRDPELINTVFRAVHSIKGGAGAFGLDALVQFAHRFETVLDALRSGTLIADKETLQTLIRAGDHLTDIMAAAQIGGVLSPQQGQHITEALDALTEQPDPSDQADSLFGFTPMALSLDFEKAPISGYTIHFRPSSRLYAIGHDPAILFRALAELGPLSIELDQSGLPGFDELEWEESYLAWVLTLETKEPAHVIEEVFEFVEGLCDLQIDPLRSPDPFPPEHPIETPPLPTEPPPSDSLKADGTPQLPKPTVRVDLERVDRLIKVASTDVV
jgi:two-component system, chemotaxis family, sensor kinase CheA